MTHQGSRARLTFRQSPRLHLARRLGVLGLFSSDDGDNMLAEKPYYIEDVCWQLSWVVRLRNMTYTDQSQDR